MTPDPHHGERCTVGVKFVRADDFGSMRYDYSEACGEPATGKSSLGFPRCELHKAARYVVTIGTSITVTKNVHDYERDARTEVRHRLGRHGLHIDTEQMTCRPATAADIERFEAIAAQTLESVTVAGSPR